MVVAEGDLVMVHGRYVGWPKPLVAVDIFKVKDGKVVEHWDVCKRKFLLFQASCVKADEPHAAYDDSIWTVLIVGSFLSRGRIVKQPALS